MELPKYSNSSSKGEFGITILKGIAEREFKWLLRPNHKEHDFGIDIYLDIITDIGQVTGKTIAAQVKTGSSFFQEKTDTGWVYRDKISHLNYYLNHDIPVIITLINDETQRAFWCYCDPLKTERTGDNWKIIVPFNNELNSSSKNQLLSYVSPVKDYASQLESFWKQNELFKSAGRILFSVDRGDIEKGDFRSLCVALERLQVNPELTSALNGKVDISIDGYNSDPRELYEVQEVISWCNSIFENITGLSYFLATDKAAHFLRLLQYIRVRNKIIKDWHYDSDLGRIRRKIEFDLTTGRPFMEDLYNDLNLFCEKYNLSIATNKEITFRIAEYLSGSKIPEHLKE